ncbi:unnamed protein product [Darwinula stevensoni]|uniref:Uncharacterized protein n=1 Tax=Darwinula stevensoni TaxID=69355 RepID=A0A7R9FRS5_9CRUS|nr:unnamed protein product [Darwinula stevensoni]CAG0901872.1 unnamed protein product [Darwinula stevensoni]
MDEGGGKTEGHDDLAFSSITNTYDVLEDEAVGTRTAWDLGASRSFGSRSFSLSGLEKKMVCVKTCCCCCCDTRVGTIVVGVLSLIGSIVALIAGSVSIAQINKVYSGSYQDIINYYGYTGGSYNSVMIYIWLAVLSNYQTLGSKTDTVQPIMIPGPNAQGYPAYGPNGQVYPAYGPNGQVIPAYNPNSHAYNGYAPTGDFQAKGGNGYHSMEAHPYHVNTTDVHGSTSPPPPPTYNTSNNPPSIGSVVAVISGSVSIVLINKVYSGSYQDVVKYYGFFSPSYKTSLACIGYTIYFTTSVGMNKINVGVFAVQIIIAVVYLGIMIYIWLAVLSNYQTVGSKTDTVHPIMIYGPNAQGYPAYGPNGQVYPAYDPNSHAFNGYDPTGDFQAKGGDGHHSMEAHPFQIGSIVAVIAGSVIITQINMVYSGIYQDIVRQYGHVNDGYKILLGIMIGFVVISSIFVLSSIALIYGAAKRNACLHLPWVIMDALYLLASLASIGFAIYLTNFAAINKINVAIFVFQVIIAVVYLGLYPGLRNTNRSESIDAAIMICIWLAVLSNYQTLRNNADTVNPIMITGPNGQVYPGYGPNGQVYPAFGPKAQAYNGDDPSRDFQANGGDGHHSRKRTRFV